MTALTDPHGKRLRLTLEAIRCGAEPSDDDVAVLVAAIRSGDLFDVHEAAPDTLERLAELQRPRTLLRSGYGGA
jgi:hypothetical protein